MADKKISALTSATTPLAGTEVLPIVQSGSTVKVTVANLTDGRTTTAAVFSGASSSDTGNLPLILDNTSTTATTGKYTGILFRGKDTINITKDVGSIRALPNDANWSDDSLVFFSRTADALTEKGRFGPTGNFLVNTQTTGGAGGFSVDSTGVEGAPVVVWNRTSRTTTSFPAVFRNGGSDVGFISYTNLAVAYNVTSDARLKKNIADADSASTLIDALQVRKFDWKDGDSHQRYGFVAQELLEVAPETVSQPADPEGMMGVDYSKLVPMLVKEIQSLRARVAQLEKK